MGKKFNGKLISNGDVSLFALFIPSGALTACFAGNLCRPSFRITEVLSSNCKKFCGNTRAEINSCPNYENLKSFRKEPRGGTGVINLLEIRCPNQDALFC